MTNILYPIEPHPQLQNFVSEETGLKMSSMSQQPKLAAANSCSFWLILQPDWRWMDTHTGTMDSSNDYLPFTHTHQHPQKNVMSENALQL